MYYSEAEIVKIYNEAKFKGPQIEILAELNICSANEIMKILKNWGIDMTKVKMTKRQTKEKIQIKKDIYAFVNHYMKTHGYAPAMGEIAEAVGIVVGTARRHVNEMIEDGIFETDHPGEGRAIRIPGHAFGRIKPKEENASEVRG